MKKLNEFDVSYKDPHTVDNVVFTSSTLPASSFGQTFLLT